MTDFEAIAARVAASRHESLEHPGTEYSARVEIDFSADFEGQVAKDAFATKLENEIISALEAAVKIVARELRLQPTHVRVKPLRVEIAVNDQASLGEEGQSQDE
jgi:hypothetical protein